MSPQERSAYHARQSLKSRLTHARLRLVEAALDQPNPTPDLRDALTQYLDLERRIKELG